MKFIAASSRKETLVIKRWSTEEEWHTLKTRITSVLKLAKEKKPTQTKFDVFVEPSDNATTQAADDDDFIA